MQIQSIPLTSSAYTKGLFICKPSTVSASDNTAMILVYKEVGYSPEYVSTGDIYDYCGDPLLQQAKSSTYFKSSAELATPADYDIVVVLLDLS